MTGHHCIPSLSNRAHKKIFLLFVLLVTLLGFIFPITRANAASSAPIVYRGDQWFGGAGVNVCTNTNGGGSKEYCGSEPILAIVDYALWTVQRVFEKGETRFYDALQAKLPTIIDLYDTVNYGNYKNYYGPRNPLTKENKVG